MEILKKQNRRIEGTVEKDNDDDLGNLEEAKQKKGEVEKMRMMTLKILKKQNRRKKK